MTPMDWGSKKVVVTGGGGFLGRVVTDKLNLRGAGSVVSVRSADYDLMQRDHVSKLFEDAQPDLVIHAAARVGGIGANMAAPADIYISNLLMGTYVIEEALKRETPKVVLVGTICSYPKFAPAPFSEDSLWDGYPEETNAPYGIAKKALLVHAQANRAQHGQNCVFVMPTNLYGPGDNFDPKTSHVIPALIRKCVEARDRGDGDIDVWGTGTATREFLYVDDAAEGIVLAAEQYESGEPLNLGSGEEISINRLAHLIAEVSGFKGDFKWDRGKPDGQPRRLVDSSRARKEIGFEAATPLREGLARTIEWYAQ
jgi:GDP-L-fucose synthase